MTIRDLIKLIDSGEITNLDTEIVVSDNGKYKQVHDYFLGENGLDCKEVYKDIDTKQSIIVLV